MKKLLAITITAVLVLVMYGIVQPDSYATKSITKQTQQPSDNATIRPERQSQQPSEAPGATTVQPERPQSQQPSEGSTDRQNGLQFNTEQSNAEDQQEDENNVIGLKDEQIKGVEQEDENEDANGDDENQIDARLIEADKKAPIAISGDNIYIVWFNNQNIPNNNSEVLFRSSNDSGVTFADKINLSNTTTADSINAEIAADGNNVIITWWERNATSIQPVVRASSDNGATFGPLLKLSANGTTGQA
jgi:hypothetical protein